MGISDKQSPTHSVIDWQSCLGALSGEGFGSQGQAEHQGRLVLSVRGFLEEGERPSNNSLSGTGSYCCKEGLAVINSTVKLSIEIGFVGDTERNGQAGWNIIIGYFQSEGYGQPLYF